MSETESSNDVDPQDLSEDDVVEFDAVPDSDMTPNGKLEMVGDNVLGARFDDLLVEFEFSHVRVTDVTSVDELDIEE